MQTNTPVKTWPTPPQEGEDRQIGFLIMNPDGDILVEPKSAASALPKVNTQKGAHIPKLLFGATDLPLKAVKKILKQPLWIGFCPEHTGMPAFAIGWHVFELVEPSAPIKKGLLWMPPGQLLRESIELPHHSIYTYLINRFPCIAA